MWRRWEICVAPRHVLRHRKPRILLGSGRLVGVLRGLGIRTLRNEYQPIVHQGATLDLIGVDDWRAKSFGGDHGYDLKKAVAGRDSAVPSVLLAHQPKAIHDAAKAEIDLVLSGHTHGGQIRSTCGAVGHAVCVRPVSTRANMDLCEYRNGLLGASVRVGTRSEITLLTLT